LGLEYPDRPHLPAAHRHGRLQWQAGVIHLLVDKIEDLSSWIAVDAGSRDFH